MTVDGWWRANWPRRSTSAVQREVRSEPDRLGEFSEDNRPQVVPATDRTEFVVNRPDVI